jgi:hypothetical protein
MVSLNFLIVDQRKRMLLSDRIMATTHGYRMLNTTRVSAVGSCLQGELEVFRFCTGTDPNTVLLVRCAYGMQEALIMRLNLGTYIMQAYPHSMYIHKRECLPRNCGPVYQSDCLPDRLGCRTSALTLTNFRYQHLMIHPISDSPPLTTLNLPSGLSMYSSRPPSPYIPRYTSFALHLMVMLYAIGQPDVSGASNVLLIEQPLTTFGFS